MDNYIGREAALDGIIGYDFQNCPDYMEDWATELKHAVICDLKDAVETLPAADVAPVVHGRWIKRNFCAALSAICRRCIRGLIAKNAGQKWTEGYRDDTENNRYMRYSVRCGRV